MDAPIERDLLGDLSHAVAAYLSVLAATGECLEQTHPDVGGPYRQSLNNLRSRLAFHATREALQESSQTVQEELKDYASIASRVSTRRSVDLESGILALGDILEAFTQRQEAYGSHLRHFAVQMEKSTYPEDPKTFSEVMALQTARLRGLVESMNQQAAATSAQMRDQIAKLEQCLAGTASTDPVTSLLNRRELDRQIEARQLHGAPFTLLLFELNGPLSDQVLRLAAAKLLTQFRHRDRLGRWSDKEFAVLFLGDRKSAQARAEKVLPWVTGRYVLDNGESVHVAARTRLVELELTQA